MALLNKSDLKYEYVWTTYQDDDPRITGKPDSTLLNREEGYEMLYFINKFAKLYNLKKKASGLKIEEMIKSRLPSNIRSQEKIKTWIYDNWKKY